MLFALLLLIAASGTLSLFVAALLFLLITFIIRVVILVAIGVLIFHIFTAEHVVVQVKVVLESVRDQYFVNVLSKVHGHVDFVTELVLFFLVHLGALLRDNAVSEHVEEALSLDSLDDGPGLVSLLVLLLLLDLLLGRILGLIGPRNGSAHYALNLIIRVGAVDDLKGEDFLSEVLILVEVEPDSEVLAGVWLAFFGVYTLRLNVSDVLEDGLVLLLD